MSAHSGSIVRQIFEEEEDTTILDTLEIDDLMKRPNLLNVMTIRSIPLQKRDPKLKLGYKVRYVKCYRAHEAIITDNLNLNMGLPFSIKRSQNMREITARPNTVRSGSALGQRSLLAKRYTSLLF